MDMKVNTDLIKQLRQTRAWSQDELATAAGLSLRTVQRIESEGLASLESKKAIAGAFGVEAASLDDNRELHARLSSMCESQKRHGMTGAMVGGLAAYAAITYSFFWGDMPAFEAGTCYGVIAAVTGTCCMLIGIACKRMKRV